MGQHIAKLAETDPTLTGLKGYLQVRPLSKQLNNH
jgi:hypothetical protein